MKCLDPYKCLHIRGNDISSCCLMPTWKVDSINYENDKNLQAIRSEWFEGKWPSACANCKSNEDLGIISRARSSLQWYKDNNISGTTVELVRLDYWCGNKCNLRCAICGPDSSIAWQKELGIKKDERITIISDTWKKIDLSKLRWIHFNGGEPLLILEHMDLLKTIVDPSQVVINYNTNATVRPTDELIQLWEKFKTIILDFSIDGIGDRFNYMRYPANWDIVEDNLFWFKDNMPVNVMFNINASVGILNKFCIESTRQWFTNNYNVNRVNDKINFNTQPVYGVLSLTAPKTNAVKFLNALDLRRGTNWQKTFPELVDYFIDP